MPLEAVELALGLLAHLVGHARLGDLRPVLLDDRAVVLAELLADRVELLAQDVLALLLLDARVHVVADAPAHLHRGEPLALEPERQLQPLGDVDRLQQLDLLLEGDLRRVAGGVGQRARLGDRADEGRDATVVAAQLEDLLDDRAVLPLELARLRRADGVSSGRSSTSTKSRPRGSVSAAPATPAVQAGQRDRTAAAGQPHAIGHLGDRAHGGVLALVLRHEQHPLLVADVDVSVTFMLGKTTRSSRGTSNSLLKQSTPLVSASLQRVATEVVPRRRELPVNAFRRL